MAFNIQKDVDWDSVGKVFSQAKAGLSFVSNLGSKHGARVKGLVMNMDTNVPYVFQFNPTTLEYGRSAEYVDISAPGSSYPVAQFVKGNAREFEVELFLYDHIYAGTIDSAEAYFSKFLPKEDNLNRYSKPPIMLFMYGTFIRKCILVEMILTKERHNDFGLPTQARLRLRLRQVSK